SMGNTFTIGSGSCTLTSPVFARRKCHEISDQVVPYDSIKPIQPVLPGTPPNNNRMVIEVAPGSTAAQIQAAIDSAVSSGSTRPVVHLQAGQYNISQTINVPAGSDLQLIGDGNNTALNWLGPAGGVLLDLQGPSKATLRDLNANGGYYTAAAV